MLVGRAADLFVEIGSFVIIISAIPLGLATCVGITVGIVQAATQVQEQSVSFALKLLATVATLYWAGPDAAAYLRQLAVEHFTLVAELAW